MKDMEARGALLRIIHLIHQEV